MHCYMKEIRYRTVYVVIAAMKIFHSALLLMGR